MVASDLRKRWGSLPLARKENEQPCEATERKRTMLFDECVTADGFLEPPREQFACHFASPELVCLCVSVTYGHKAAKAMNVG